MAKIRHTSYRAEDVDAMAKFFIDALGLTMVQKRKDGSVDLSDGAINIAILPMVANKSRRAGLEHIGFPPRTIKSKSAG
jgi:catechol 2,3-dioxygenase-like lactoylglutathione lyase family enzyme